jgi:hypothetical protein
MYAFARREAGLRVLRPLARAADGIVHNRERRNRIHRYRRVTRVAVVAQRGSTHAALTGVRPLTGVSPDRAPGRFAGHE